MGDLGVVVLMGLTGSGKSTFISLLTGQKDVVGVGHGLSSGTSDTASYTVQCTSGEVVHLVDTPGFDDTSVSDEDVLRKIMAELETHERLLGIIYLHRITDVRLSGSSLRGFNILRELCRPESYHKIVLATTMWSNADISKGGRGAAIRREDQLWEYHWSPLFEGRSKMVRHHNTTESAQSIAELFLRGRTLGPPSKQDSAIDLLAALDDAEADLCGQHWLSSTEDQSHPREAESRVQEDKAVMVVNATDEDLAFEARFPDENSDNGERGDYYRQANEWERSREEIQLCQPQVSAVTATEHGAEKGGEHQQRIGSEENRTPGKKTQVVRRASWLSRRLARRTTSPAAVRVLGWSSVLVFFSGVAYKASNSVGSFFSPEKQAGNPLAF